MAAPFLAASAEVILLRALSSFAEEALTDNTHNVLRVVAGVFYFKINHQPSVLLFERKLSANKESKKSVFEFPGGKVECLNGQPESDQQALGRELLEELSVNVDVGNWIGHHQFIPPHSLDKNKKIDLHLYQVSLRQDQSVYDFQLHEHLSCIQIPLSKEINFSLAQYVIRPKQEYQQSLSLAQLSFGDEHLWSACYSFFAAVSGVDRP